MAAVIDLQPAEMAKLTKYGPIATRRAGIAKFFKKHEWQSSKCSRLLVFSHLAMARTHHQKHDLYKHLLKEENKLLRLILIPEVFIVKGCD